MIQCALTIKFTQTLKTSDNIYDPRAIKGQNKSMLDALFHIRTVIATTSLISAFLKTQIKEMRFPLFNKFT